MRRVLILFAVVGGLALGSWPRTASAQVGIWLQKGVSGFGFGAGIRGGSHQTELTFGGGYSYQGFLDFELDAGYIWPSDIQPDDIHIVSVSPGVIYHALKQNADIPVSVSFGASYTQNFWQSPTLSDDNIDVTDYALSFNAAAYRFFRIGSQTGVIPAISVGYGHEWAKSTINGTEIPNGDAESDTVAVTFGAYFAYIDESGRIYGLVPSVQVNQHGDAFFGLSLNIIWSTQ